MMGSDQPEHHAEHSAAHRIHGVAQRHDKGRGGRGREGVVPVRHKQHLVPCPVCIKAVEVYARVKCHYPYMSPISSCMGVSTSYSQATLLPASQILPIAVHQAVVHTSGAVDWRWIASPLHSSELKVPSVSGQEMCQSTPCRSSRMPEIALQAAAVAPEVTATWDTSMRNTCVGSMGGRTCEQQDMDWNATCLHHYMTMAATNQMGSPFFIQIMSSDSLRHTSDPSKAMFIMVDCSVKFLHAGDHEPLRRSPGMMGLPQIHRYHRTALGGCLHLFGGRLAPHSQHSHAA